MGLITVLTAIASVIIWLYRVLIGMPNAPERVQRMKSTAATIAAVTKAFFDILTAMQTGSPPVTVLPAQTGTTPRFGSRLSIGASSALSAGISGAG